MIKRARNPQCFPPAVTFFTFLLLSLFSPAPPVNRVAAPRHQPLHGPTAAPSLLLSTTETPQQQAAAVAPHSSRRMWVRFPIGSVQSSSTTNTLSHATTTTTTNLLTHFLVSPIVSHFSLFKLINLLVLTTIYHVYELYVDCVLVSLNSSMGNS